MLVRFDHVASFIVNANHYIMRAAAKLRDVPALVTELEAIGDDPREVQRVPQPCCLKKERERSSLSARAPSYYDYENNFYFMSLSSPEGSPRSESLIEKQVKGQA